MKGHKKIAEEYRDEAKKKAYDFLSGGRFYMFGYWASVWMQMNKLSRIRKVNPFLGLIDLAKKIKEQG